MPRSTREYIQRYADHALNDLARALDNLGKIRSLYGAPLPPVEADDGGIVQPMSETEPGRYDDYIHAVESIGMLVAQAHELLTQMRKLML